jgi:hypothetical protein
MKPADKPTDSQIKGASEHVAWEYDIMLAAALEMANNHGSPINHLVQEAFLVHVRSLAEFFSGPNPQKKRDKDNIYAVDLCHSVGWKPERLAKSTNLIKAINKTLSHMTYSRDRASESHAHFEGHSHLHGTVKLMRQTWRDFLKCLRREFLHPENPKDIYYWLNYHTRNWEVSIPSHSGERLEFGALESQFETRVNELARTNPAWVLNKTPDEQALSS